MGKGYGQAVSSRDPSASLALESFQRGPIALRPGAPSPGHHGGCSSGRGGGPGSAPHGQGQPGKGPPSPGRSSRRLPGPRSRASPARAPRRGRPRCSVAASAVAQAAAPLAAGMVGRAPRGAGSAHSPDGARRGEPRPARSDLPFLAPFPPFASGASRRVSPPAAGARRDSRSGALRVTPAGGGWRRVMLCQITAGVGSRQDPELSPGGVPAVGDWRARGPVRSREVP